MRWLGYLLFGGASGALIATLAPDSTSNVVRAIEDTGLDRALTAAAMGSLPAGDERERCEALVHSIAPPVLDA